MSIYTNEMNTEEGMEYLLLRHLQDLTTEDENRRIAEWAAAAPENQAVLERLQNKDMLREDLQSLFTVMDTFDEQERFVRMKEHIQSSIAEEEALPVRHLYLLHWKYYIAAAVALIFAIGGVYRYWRSEVPSSNMVVTTPIQRDVQPGGNRAVLTLADGQHIDLAESQSGIQLGDALTYLDGSPVGNASFDKQLKQQTMALQLHTPKGGTYQLTLPDGTKVWLNASSSLKYPSRFEGRERVVELEGEAYFDVATVQDKTTAAKLPFRVVSKGQTIEVLGTQFNVSAYADESIIRTTLVEGSVRLTHIHDDNPVILFPNEQAGLQNSKIFKQKVDVRPYVAWKDGQFLFKKTPVEEVMKQIARWYDVEVIYARGIPKETLSGKVNRDVTLTGLLEILQLSSIHVTLEGDKLTVH